MADEAVTPTYVLGHDDEELARLRHQAELYGPATRLILEQAGVQAGMRILDLGSGAGDLAMLAAELVGTTGQVVGIDQAPGALDAARSRVKASGLAHVRFEHGDVTTWRDADSFDAVIGRFVLMHVADPVAVVRHHSAAVRPGGVVVAIESDTTATRSIPPVSLLERLLGLAHEAARRLTHEVAPQVDLGPRLPSVFAAAGLADTTTLGIQTYVPPGDPNGARQLASIVRAVIPMIERAGVATATEMDPPTLGARLENALADATVVMPTIVGAWSVVR